MKFIIYTYILSVMMLSQSFSKEPCLEKESDLELAVCRHKIIDELKSEIPDYNTNYQKIVPPLNKKELTEIIPKLKQTKLFKKSNFDIYKDRQWSWKLITKEPVEDNKSFVIYKFDINNDKLDEYVVTFVDSPYLQYSGVKIVYDNNFKEINIWETIATSLKPHQDGWMMGYTIGHPFAFKGNDNNYYINFSNLKPFNVSHLLTKLSFKELDKPSFNCMDIGYDIVSMSICMSPTLKKLDRTVNKLYKESKNKDKKVSHRKWIKKRDLCEIKGIYSCLTKEYNQRLEQLK